MNHTGVECDVNPINYGQPPPGLNAQQHQQQQQVGRTNIFALKFEMLVVDNQYQSST